MLTLILKVTNGCNMNCQYCSVGDKSDFDVMSEDDMDRAFDWFCHYAEDKGEKKVSIILHGGEPMLIPAEQYDRSLRKILNNYNDIQFTFRIQTNGTILNGTYLALFQKYEFHIGISLDGLSSVHDRQRRDISGNGTFDLIFRNIRKLQSDNLPVSALMVLTKNSLNTDYGYLNYLSEYHIPVKINPLLKIGQALVHEELCLDEGDYGRYLIGLHKYVLEQEIGIHISPLAELQQAIIHEAEPRGCVFHGSCSYNFICIDQIGTLYPCGRFADQHKCILGNIYEGITKEGRRIQENLYARRSYSLPEKCQSCRYIKLCHAGCSAVTEVGEIGKPSVMCGDYHILFDYLYGEGLEKYKKYLLKKKEQIEEQILTFRNAYEL